MTLRHKAKVGHGNLIADGIFSCRLLQLPLNSCGDCQRANLFVILSAVSMSLKGSRCTVNNSIVQLKAALLKAEQHDTSIEYGWLQIVPQLHCPTSYLGPNFFQTQSRAPHTLETKRDPMLAVLHLLLVSHVLQDPQILHRLYIASNHVNEFSDLSHYMCHRINSFVKSAVFISPRISLLLGWATGETTGGSRENKQIRRPRGKKAFNSQERKNCMPWHTPLRAELDQTAAAGALERLLPDTLELRSTG
jgi:hypothetical protein